MDYQTLATAVTSLGFPIVACVGMYMYQIKRDKTYDENTAKLTEIISENTQILKRILDKLNIGDE